MNVLENVPEIDRPQVREVARIMGDINASLSLLSHWGGHQSLCAVFEYNLDGDPHRFYLLECDYLLEDCKIHNPRNANPVLYPCRDMATAVTAAEDWYGYFMEELDKLFVVDGEHTEE